MPAKHAKRRTPPGGLRSGATDGVRGDPGHSRIPQGALRRVREPTRVSGLAHHLRSAKARYGVEEGTDGAPAELRALAGAGRAHGASFARKAAMCFVEPRDLGVAQRFR